MVSLRNLTLLALPFLLAGSISVKSFAGQFDSGPPILHINLEVAEDVFSGVVGPLQAIQPGERGDTATNVTAEQVWKGGLKPGDLVRVTFFRNCPRLVRTSDCKRHLLRASEGDRIVFFARGQKTKFAGRAFGSREHHEVAPALNAIAAGKTINWAAALMRMLRGRSKEVDVIEGILLPPRNSKIPSSGPFMAQSTTVLVKVENVFAGRVKPGDQLDVIVSRQMYEHFVVFPDPKAIPGDRVVLIRHVTGAPDGQTSTYQQPISGAEMAKQEAKFAEIVKDERRSYNWPEYRAPIGGITRFWRAFTSLENYLMNREFDVGFDWNPEPDAYPSN